MSSPNPSNSTQTLSLKQARRIALAAQGFLPQAGGIKRHSLRRHSERHFDQIMDHIAPLQLDSVNVLDRAHYLTLYARLGHYDKQKADALFHQPQKTPRRYFEYWGHEASLMPVELYPAFHWRMMRAQNGEGVWRSLSRFATENKHKIEAVYALIEREGPLSSSQVKDRLEPNKPKKSGDWWGWSGTKLAVEYLFWCGRIASGGRQNFQRFYDLPERILPSDIMALPALSQAQACRDLMARSAKAHGVASEKDLRDYFRLDAKQSKQALASLLEEGSIEPVSITGWKEQAYLHKDAILPARANCQTLLAPFDSLIWFRERTERLWGCHYRIEIYVPKPKRVYGYYVLPYLQGDQITARLDLKANRQDGYLDIRASHLEKGADQEKVLVDLVPELSKLAIWQGLQAPRLQGPGFLKEAHLSQFD
ncbi:MAG: winged helix DNA-binding domain-containing protein [Cohaesibacter sp.]|nr:winged helix DNA-binding domain-containing protein [Cohaesibacter sp.]